MTTATFVTNQGSFTVTLMPEHAPKTVANFVGLARAGRRGRTHATGRRRTMPCTPARSSTG